MSFLTNIKNKLAEKNKGKRAGSHPGKPLYCSAVIAAAGASQRMQGEDKLFVEIGGAPALAHTLIAMQSNRLINEIIVVARDFDFERIGEICKRYSIGKVSKIMVGGPTRLESVLSGVLAVSDRAQIIAVHDGARPCVDAGVIARAVTAAAKYHAVAPAMPVISTLKRAKGNMIAETVSREDLYEIQTPQVFKAEIIKAALTKALDKAVEITDDCMAAELINVPVHIVEGSRSNIKLTTSEDLMIAEGILNSRKAATKMKAEGVKPKAET